MPPITPFPKAPGDSNPIALDGALYNRIVGALEAAAKLNVAPPLTLTDGPGGKTISLLAASNIVFVKLSSTETPGGRYSGKIFQGPINTSYWPTYTFQAEDMGTLPSADDAEIWNPTDNDAGTANSHSLNPANPADQIRAGLVVGMTNESTPRKIVVLFTDQPLQGGLIYQVLMTIDGNGDYAWDYPRFP